MGTSSRQAPPNDDTHHVTAVQVVREWDEGSVTLHDFPWPRLLLSLVAMAAGVPLGPLVRRAALAAMGSRVPVPDAAKIYLVGPHRAAVRAGPPARRAEEHARRGIQHDEACSARVAHRDPAPRRRVARLRRRRQEEPAAQWCGVPELGGSCLYFASSAATEARRDLLSATVEHQQVPNLVGMTIEQARATVSGVRLALVLPDPVSPLGPGIASQDSLCRGRRGRGSDRAGLRVTRTVGRSGPGSAAWSDPAGPPTDRAAGRPVTAA
jgi:hypothetical protein